MVEGSGEERESRPELSDELREFVSSMYGPGFHVLSCGGGVDIEPGKLFKAMAPSYAEDELCRLCMELLLDTPREAVRVPEFVYGALGILYYVADRPALDRLIAALDDPDVPCGESVVRYAVAGLCARFELPLPEGVEPLDEQHMYYVFGVLQ
jgi:hypothetical protein